MLPIMLIMDFVNSGVFNRYTACDFHREKIYEILHMTKFIRSLAINFLTPKELAICIDDREFVLLL